MGLSIQGVCVVGGTQILVAPRSEVSFQSLQDALLGAWILRVAPLGVWHAANTTLDQAHGQPRATLALSSSAPPLPREDGSLSVNRTGEAGSYAPLALPHGCPDRLPFLSSRAHTIVRSLDQKDHIARVFRSPVQKA